MDAAGHSAARLTVLATGAACLQAFLQINWTGPPLEQFSLADLLRPAVPSGHAFPSDEAVLRLLSVDSEEAYTLTVAPWLLLAAKALLVDGRAPGRPGCKVRGPVGRDTARPPMPTLTLAGTVASGRGCARLASQTDAWWALRAAAAWQHVLDNGAPTVQTAMYQAITDSTSQDADGCRRAPMLTDVAVLKPNGGVRAPRRRQWKRSWTPWRTTWWPAFTSRPRSRT